MRGQCAAHIAIGIPVNYSHNSHSTAGHNNLVNLAGCTLYYVARAALLEELRRSSRLEVDYWRGTAEAPPDPCSSPD